MLPWVHKYCLLKAHKYCLKRRANIARLGLAGVACLDVQMKLKNAPVLPTGTRKRCKIGLATIACLARII